MRFASLPATRFLTSRTDEATVNGSLVTDLGLSPEVWLFLSLLGCVTLFFKFSRFWSVRNLDLLLLFVLAPGMMLIVGNPRPSPVERVHLAVPGVGVVADPLLGRPGSSAAAAAGAESERLGIAVPFGGGAGLAAGRDDQPAGRGRGGPKPGRAVGTRGSPRRRRRHAGNPAVRQVIADQGLAAVRRSRTRTPQVIVAPGAGEHRPSGAGSRPARDRLAALRAAADGYRDGRVLSAASRTRGWRWSIAVSSSRRP